MPRLMMVGNLLRGTLKVVPLPIPAPDRPAGLILPRDRAPPPAGRAFIECVRAYVSEIGETGIVDITGGSIIGRKNDATLPHHQR
jgi:LysR family transcriptional regulator, pca operon transcriptional activator